MYRARVMNELASSPWRIFMRSATLSFLLTFSVLAALV